MLKPRTVFEIHRLAHEGYSLRSIAKTMGISRKAARKYLQDPTPTRPTMNRPSKMDPFKDEVERCLAANPRVSAQVIFQRLRAQGFDGGRTIVKDLVRILRPGPDPKAFIRFESAPGEQCQVDWGHFAAIPYGNTSRKLSCLAVVESHSRILYLEFTHSQDQDTLHRCLQNAFRFFGGTPKYLVCDNMLTAVIEREGPVIRYNDAFLAFLQPLRITPHACNVRKPNEKGKVEKGAIHYIRHNFLPLRSFASLDDVQAQAVRWRDTVANVRVHATTGERPCDRFQPQAMTPLPEALPDCRTTRTLRVYSDFSIVFDANHYSVPPWAVGKFVTVKADPDHVQIFYKDRLVATHPRSWERKLRIENAEHREAARRHKDKFWLSPEAAAFLSLGEDAKVYLEGLAQTHQPLKKNLKHLLALESEYGREALMDAVRHAAARHAFGADSVQNILVQRKSPKRDYPPITLRREDLNHVRLETPCLERYDALVLKRRHSHD